MSAAREMLGRLTHRNLLEVAGYYEDGTPATYRFQPALRQEAVRRVTPDERAALDAGYAAYANWFVGYARDEITRDPAIARLAQQAMNELLAQADAQPADRLAQYCWMLGEVLQQFGLIGDAERILARGAAHAEKVGDEVRRERILFQQAQLAVLRGDLDRALSQYEQAAELAKAEKNDNEHSVILQEMAGIYKTRGFLDKALQNYEEAFAIQKRNDNLREQGVTLHNMAGIFITRGDLDGAMRLYQQSLDTSEQLGDLQGKSATLHEMAGVLVTRGDLDGAMRLYQQSLQIHEQLGDLKGSREES